ncbi:MULTISPECIES: 5-formyltetrahydrofolate cyclo-ligase [unclassified Ensifer]|uniref:5-formyltetrahydrofolate cyclo-ligase n=1 Tax=unclassified Ensifer TaxID=2633371 RepID=UPI000812CC92|nr:MULTISPECIES: 5-formyltetrahydrofolate cyclo-ligase [unclassified Ensifer]OCP25201.1 5-formyltetrahydrofolate cyclo-ligase [Ensifer sp. LC54]OCP25545.1 5-formyltetrahydrofolate cyclo-ligase [Ensifer sp. LC384]OCP34940.1 5-formyltetrahydrofolate cyclo-ligase [Ensifer sp. LC163]
MNGNNEDDISPTYSSSPCRMNEVDPTYIGLGEAEPNSTYEWRKPLRQALINSRQTPLAAERAVWSQAIQAAIDPLVPDVEGKAIALYWPFRGEPDLRPWMNALVERGALCLLPVVVAKAQPLSFRSWRPGEPLERGVWGIPVPAGGQPVEPSVVVAPVVGFDKDGFRLGYGGGYYDRTLAVLRPKPLVIGVGFERQKIESIRPQWHDIAMDAIVTEMRTRLRT